LGKWVHNMRNEESLSNSRIKRLEEIGFIWQPVRDRWGQSFAQLKRYKEENGHCNVPRDYKTSSGMLLGDWVSRQRKTKNTLSNNRFEQLERLGIIWNILDQNWEKALSELHSYKKMYGDYLVPGKYETPSHFALGSWVATTRYAYKNGKLPLEKIDHLNTLEFVWDVIGNQWEIGFSELEIFQKETGNCLVPSVYKSLSGFNLGNWVGTQRKKKNSLNGNLVQRLDNLGFSWSMRKPY
jgi:hypothetical protein